MRCFTSLVLVAAAGAEESLFDDSAVQLLQLKASAKQKEADVLNALEEEALNMTSRPNTKSTEASSMQNAECDFWGRSKLTKTWYGFTPDHLAVFGFLYVKDTNGADKMVADMNTPGLHTMAKSKDERFIVQTYHHKHGSGNTIAAAAFSVDGTIIRLIPPETETLQRCVIPTKSAGCKAWPYDDNAVLKTWSNRKIRIRIGDKELSQFDLPYQVPGTGIQITQHKWNMNPQIPMESGFIIDNDDGFRAQVRVTTSNGDALWTDINLKFAPDNIPDRYQDSLCGRGGEATPIGVAPYDLHDYGGDWEHSFFTANDQQDICYVDTRLFGAAAHIVADPPWCPSLRETKWVGGDRMAKMWRGGWGEPEGYGPGGEGQCIMTPELKEEAWNMIESYAMNTLTWGYAFCSQPKREPPPTPEGMCTKNKCDLSIGEGICEPLQGAEGGEGDAEGGGIYHDCLLEFCAECEEVEAQEFVSEVQEQFPAVEDDDDEAAAVGDPHVTTNTDRTFDMKA